jgi:hypothetical protein
MTLKVLKFSLGNPKKPTQIIYESMSEFDDDDGGDRKVSESVHPDLISELSYWLPMAIKLAKNDPMEWASGEITGVTFKHGPEGIGAVFSMQLRADGVCLCDNTPFVQAGSLDQTKIMLLHQEIVACFNGKREYQQASLALDVAPATKKTGTKTSKKATKEAA